MVCGVFTLAPAFAQLPASSGPADLSVDLKDASPSVAGCLNPQPHDVSDSQVPSGYGGVSDYVAAIWSGAYSPAIPPSPSSTCLAQRGPSFSLASDAQSGLRDQALTWLRETLGPARPVIESRPGFYHDSDGNNVLNTRSSVSLSVSNIQLSLLHGRTDAFGPAGHQAAEQGLAAFSVPLSEVVSVNGGVGLSLMDHTIAPLGRLETNAVLGRMSVDVAVSREALPINDTTIKYGIALTNVAVSFSYRLAELLLLSLDYHYKKYSDHNDANDLQLALGHAFHIKWSELNLGWRLAYTDFARETWHGYFAPSNFFSYAPFAAWSFDRGTYYADAELSAGRQSYRYGDENSRDFMGSGSGTFGVRLSANTSLEVSAEGGNYALGTLSTGWNYFSTSIRLKHAF
jgi:hypothetical protein